MARAKPGHEQQAKTQTVMDRLLWRSNNWPRASLWSMKRVDRFVGGRENEMLSLDRTPEVGCLTGVLCFPSIRPGTGDGRESLEHIGAALSSARAF
jgi:hypothetical protein